MIAPWPPIGLGTWRMGEAASTRQREIAAVRTAVEIGYRVFDTAEMYGDGGAERVVGAALRACLEEGIVRREELFVVSKVYPHHASEAGVRSAGRASLDRLGLDRLDAYLLHWRGAVPLAETVAGFEALRREGLIGRWGVSNFDVADLDELWSIDGGSRCAVNQVYYSLGSRGPAFALLPWHRGHGVATMAYSPIDQGALSANPAAGRVAARHGATAAQVALAWVAQQGGVMAIPKAVGADHLRENLAAPSLTLDASDQRELDAAFAPPRRKTPLAMI